MGTPFSAQADARSDSGLRIQHITQGVNGGCIGSPELDEHIAAELKQLTGRAPVPGPAAASNPLLAPPEAAPVFGGYVEPIDNGCFRARLWLKAAGTPQVAVRDTFYPTQERLAAELPQDAVALILMPDWSRTASAAPYYCGPQGKSAAYPEDACDPFLPPPGCGVPFVCTPGDRTPRCATGPSCGVAGRPPCPSPETRCQVRDWRLGTGVAALVVGGLAVTLGGVFQFASTEGLPAAVTSYVAGGTLLGAGAGLIGDFALHAKTVPCSKGN